MVSPQHQVTFEPAGSYAVDGLKPDTLYVFSMAAQSDVGLGVFTQPIEARTPKSCKCSPLPLCFGSVSFVLWGKQCRPTAFAQLWPIYIKS